MITYLDRIFCPKRDCPNTDCPRFFDERKYLKACELTGFEFPVSWLTEPPELCPKSPSTRGLAIRTGRKRKERELMRQMKGGAK